MEDVLTPQVLPFLVLGAALSSLIPAFVVKILMSGVFRHRVSYLMVFIAFIISVVAMIGVLVFLGLADEQSFEALPLDQSLGLTAAGFLVQALLLAAMATDENHEFIALWKWVAVLILQYVVYVVIAFIIAFAVILVGTS